MNRTKSFIDGIVLSYGNQIVVMAVGLWLTPFLLHRLGQHDYGTWLVGLQSLGYLTLLDLGVVGLLPREVAAASGKIHKGADSSLLRKILEENLVVVCWQTPIVFVAMVIAWFVFRDRAGGHIQGVLLIILITFGLQFPLRIFYAALEGLQDFAFIGYLQMAAWFAGVAANVTLVIFGWRLYSVAIGWALTQAIVAAGSICRMYLRFPEFTPRSFRRLSFSEVWKYLRSAFWVSVPQLTQVLVRGSDVVLLAGVKGAGAVVPYSCTTKLQMVLANQPQVVLQAAQPGLSQLRATGDMGQTGRVIGALGQAMLVLSGAVTCAILIVNKGFVIHWVGQSQYLGVWFTVLICLGMLCRHLNSTTVYTLFCFHKERYISMVGFSDAICFVVLCFVFLRLFGVIGIPLASIISVCLVSLPWNFLVLKKVAGMSLKDQFSPFLEWFVPFSAIATASAVAGALLPLNNYFTCGIAAVATVAVYFLAEWNIIRRSLWGQRIINLVRERLTAILRLVRPDALTGPKIEEHL